MKYNLLVSLIAITYSLQLRDKKNSKHKEGKTYKKDFYFPLC